jgi:hypothetical protein
MAKIDYHARIDTRSQREHIGVRVLPIKPAGQKDPSVQRIVVLRPGVNRIDDSEWDAVRDSTAVMQLRASGMLTVLEDSEAKAAHRIVEATVWQAQQLADRTTDPAVLEQWIDELEGSPLLDSKDVGPMWVRVLAKCKEHHTEATTDAKGKPAKPRKIRLGSEAA